MANWLQATWEGLLAWAYRAAQRFERRLEDEGECDVFVAPPLLLKNFFDISVLKDDALRLQTKPRRLNLVVCKKESDTPTAFERLRILGLAAIYEFHPLPQLISN